MLYFEYTILKSIVFKYEQAKFYTIKVIICINICVFSIDDGEYIIKMKGRQFKIGKIWLLLAFMSPIIMTGPCQNFLISPPFRHPWIQIKQCCPCFGMQWFSCSCWKALIHSNFVENLTNRKWRSSKNHMFLLMCLLMLRFSLGCSSISMDQ